MKKFLFKFESLLRNMILKEEIVQKEFAVIAAEVDAKRNVLNEAIAELEIQKKIMEEKLQSGSNVATISLSNDFINTCANKIRRLESDLLKAEEKLSEKRVHLLEAVKNRKTIETLKDNDYKGYLFKVMKEEQKFIDEISTQREFYKEEAQERRGSSDLMM